MNINKDRGVVTTWYRQPWAWFVILLPLLTVVAGLTTVYIAFRNVDPLVSDEYYKEGLAINQVIDKQKNARALTLSAALSFDADNWVKVKLDAKNASAISELRLHLIHSTLADQDQFISLAKAPDGSYVGRSTAISKGKWIVDLEPTNGKWRLSEAFYFPADAPVLLR